MIDFEQRKKDLQELVNKSWQEKVGLTISKLMEFYVRTDGNCYLSCSGGADSVVLLDICRKVEQLNQGWKFRVVFDDTGLEEPTVREKALSIEDVCVVRPEISFLQVLTQYGYPVVSKEVSECVNNARKHLTGGGYNRHYKKLFGIGEFATKSTENIGSTSKPKGYP